MNLLVSRSGHGIVHRITQHLANRRAQRQSVVQRNSYSRHHYVGGVSDGSGVSFFDVCLFVLFLVIVGLCIYFAYRHFSQKRAAASGMPS